MAQSHLLHSLQAYLESVYGLRPVPFYLGIAFAVLGLLLSLTLVRDTTAQMDLGFVRQTLQKLSARALRSRVSI